MEERITIKKESVLKELVLLGLQAKGYQLIQVTETQNPIKIFYNESIGYLAIYDSGPFQDDEIVIVNLRKTMKVNVLIKEYCSKKLFTQEQNRFDQVIDILKNLSSKYQNQKEMEGTPKDPRIINLSSETTSTVKTPHRFSGASLQKNKDAKV